jgi:hypothetical protein
MLVTAEVPPTSLSFWEASSTFEQSKSRSLHAMCLCMYVPAPTRCIKTVLINRHGINNVVLSCRIKVFPCYPVLTFKLFSRGSTNIVVYIPWSQLIQQLGASYGTVYFGRIHTGLYNVHVFINNTTQPIRSATPPVCHTNPSQMTLTFSHCYDTVVSKTINSLPRQHMVQNKVMILNIIL